MIVYYTEMQVIRHGQSLELFYRDFAPEPQYNLGLKDESLVTYALAVSSV